MKPILILDNISFSYDDKLIIDNINYEILHNEIISVVGPSGCGKSTLLRLISKLEIPNAGNIKIKQIDGEKSTLRYLFQDYDAFPWYTTIENVRQSIPDDIQADNCEIKNLLKKLGIWESRNKYPKELSVGMRKRLGLARCLIAKPTLLLLDEPFAALDIDTKQEIYSVLQDLQKEYNQTIIMITHDLNEAVLLGKKVIVSSVLPFRIKSIVDISFNYPRTDSLYSNSEFQTLSNKIREEIIST